MRARGLDLNLGTCLRWGALVVGLLAAMPAAASVAALDALPATPQIQAGVTATPSTTFAISAGSNRLLVVIVAPGFNGNPSGQSVTVTYGGQALTQVQVSDVTQRRFVWIGYLEESDIAARSGDTVQVTLANTTNLRGTNVYIASYSGVDQTTPVTASGTRYINNTNTAVALNAALAVNAGGFGVFAVHANDNANPADAGGQAYVFGNGVQSGNSGSYSRAADKAFGAGTTTNVSLSYGQVRAGLVGLTLNPSLTGADLAITKDGSTIAYRGDTITYTITVTNNGPQNATGVTVSDPLPGNVLWTSTSTSQGTCSGTTTVTCNLGNLANGASATVTITVMANAGTGTASNTATVSGSPTDPTPGNNSATLNTTLTQINTVDLAITKTGPASAASGSNATYSITVTNNGPDTANAVTMVDPLPPGMTLFSVPTTTVGTCTGAVGGVVVSCALGNLANGASATIGIVGTISSKTTQVNTATIGYDTATTYDSNPLNNAASWNTTVTGPAPTAPVCNVPPNLVDGGTLTGIVNTYYAGTASVVKNTANTCIPLGPAVGKGDPILGGDLLIVLQMQDAQINSTNTDCYGSGVGCNNTIGGTGAGAGATAGTVNAGKFEFVRAAGTVGQPVVGTQGCAAGAVPISGAGANNGLINDYFDANATATQGQRRYQVVRGLEFKSATLTSANAISGPAWSTDANGRGTGGVVALDVSGVLTLGSGVVATADGLGFRGAAGRQLGGEGRTPDNATCSNPVVTPNGQDWRLATGSTSADPCETHGGKGEGNAGTPAYVFVPGTGLHSCGSASYPNVLATNQPNDGYPNGSMARGAPGNAGGGSTDPNPTANDENSGGGGGSNGGAGGTGGRSWNSNLDRGGRGAAVVPAPSQLVLGGGGGAGTRNNDNCGVNDATADDEGMASSGAAGGGLVFLRAGSYTITPGAIVSANGSDAYNDTKNDGGGGGGAGGSIVLTVTTGTMTGLTARANGGRGGDAWRTSDGTTFPGNRHGPGGGGGGGVVAYTNTPGLPTAQVNGGANGITTTANDNFFAQPGGVGVTLYLGALSIPGVGSAADCSPDPAIKLQHNPASQTPGSTVQFVTTVSNVANFISTSGTVSVTIHIDNGLAFSGLASGTGWTCSAPVGQNVTCTRPGSGGDALVAHASYPAITFNATVVSGGPATLSDNYADVIYTGDVNLTNNHATDVVGVKTPTLARIRRFEAVRHGGVVALSWQTSFEADNLGFRVYREEDGIRRILHPSLIAGSALFVGEGSLLSGRSYGWVDRNPGRDPIYWLEDVALDGTRTLTGPALPVDGTSADPRLLASPLLAGLGNAREIARTTAAPGLGVERRVVAPEIKENNSWRLARQPAAKLLLEHEGWYRISRGELAAAGFDPGTSAAGLHLTVDGVRQTLFVRDGGAGRFDPDDTLEFYGLGIDSPYDRRHVYWLTGGRTASLSLPSAASPAVEERFAPAATAASFPFVVERRDRTLYFAALTNNGDGENFFGAVVTPEPGPPQKLTVTHLDATSPVGTAALRVRLQGGTADQSHDVAVVVNGHDAGTVSYYGQERGSRTFDLPLGWLHEGENEVALTELNPGANVSVVDALELTYPHLYALDEGALRLTAAGGTTLTLGNVPDPTLRVMDVTRPARVRELPVQLAPDGGGGFTATVNVPGGRTATLFAFTAGRVLAPDRVANVPSSLHDGKSLPGVASGIGGADMVVVAHPSLLASLQPLQQLRTGQGLVTTVVDVTDVYDEFSFGQRSPLALRDFFAQSRRWRHPPRFVLLAGDASVDPKNYLGFGDFDLVPSKLVPTEYLKTASDDWLVDFDENGLPDLAIGRLPARTASAAATMVARVLDHEAAASEPPGDVASDWRQRVLLVTDAAPEFDFDTSADEVAARVPAGLAVDRVAASALGAGTRAALLEQLGQGQLLVNYFGHGSEQVWSQSSLLDAADVLALANGSKRPFVIGMTCLNGIFVDVYADSLAEAMLAAPNGGAVAVWTSSSLTEPSPQAEMDDELFRLLFQGPPITLGEAVAAAKRATSDPDVRRTWIFFGDPSMKLR